MQLIMKKNQKDIKGMLGGQKAVTFIIEARVKLEDDESALCKKYFPQNEVISTWVRPSDQAKTEVTIGKLLNGYTYSCTRLDDILSAREVLIGATQTLHEYFEAASTFGGEERIEIPEKY